MAFLKKFHEDYPKEKTAGHFLEMVKSKYPRAYEDLKVLKGKVQCYLHPRHQDRQEAYRLSGYILALSDEWFEVFPYSSRKTKTISGPLVYKDGLLWEMASISLCLPSDKWKQLEETQILDYEKVQYRLFGMRALDSI